MNLLQAALLAIMAIASVSAFLAYGHDKRAARCGARRIPERVLHGLALIGGWPGAALAQQVFAHKRAKPSFRRAFRLSVVAHVALAWRVFALPG